jgi:biotin transport system permease protein
VLGFYIPGTSPLHRASAGLKLAVLAVGLLLLGWWRTPAGVAIGVLAVLALAALSGVGLRAIGGQLRPVLWFAVAVGALQVWLEGPVTALVVVGALLVAVALAGLVTLTTRTEALLDAVVSVLRPVRRFGVDPERVALVLALAVRAVPVMADLARDVQQARAARGAERSVRAFVVPFVIRSVRFADLLGEALAARGVGDPVDEK